MRDAKNYLKFTSSHLILEITFNVSYVLALKDHCVTSFYAMFLFEICLLLFLKQLVVANTAVVQREKNTNTQLFYKLSFSTHLFLLLSLTSPLFS